MILFIFFLLDEIGNIYNVKHTAYDGYLRKNNFVMLWAEPAAFFGTLFTYLFIYSVAESMTDKLCLLDLDILQIFLKMNKVTLSLQWRQLICCQL